MLDDERAEERAVLGHLRRNQPAVLCEYLQHPRHGFRVANREERAVLDVLGVGFHPLAALQDFDERGRLFGPVVVDFEFERFVQRFDGLRLLAEPRLDEAEVEPRGRVVRELLREFGIGLLGLGEFPDAGGRGQGARRGAKRVGFARRVRKARFGAEHRFELSAKLLVGWLGVHRDLEDGPTGDGPVEHQFRARDHLAGVGERPARFRRVGLERLAE